MLDDLTDNSYFIAQEIIEKKGIVIVTTNANIGYSLRIAAYTALQRFQYTYKYWWLANTDGNCEVPINWLIDQIDCANQGFQSVAGIIKMDAFIESLSCSSVNFDKALSIYDSPGLPQVHGANFGIRADAYLKIGGWNELRTVEAHVLWERLTQHNIPKISNTNIWVYYSGRDVGRA